MVLGSDNRKAWSSMDVLLAQAYQVIQDEKCPQHGGPRWLCDNADPKLNIRIGESSCEAKRVLKDEEERRKDDEDAGVVLYPEFYDLDGRDLIEFRELYRQQKAAEAAEDAAD